MKVDQRVVGTGQKTHHMEFPAEESVSLVALSQAHWGRRSQGDVIWKSLAHSCCALRQAPDREP